MASGDNSIDLHPGVVNRDVKPIAGFSFLQATRLTLKERQVE
jgi:hypothetical protein